MALIVIDHTEGILDPDVMPVTMPEAVLEGPSATLDEGRHLIKDPRRVLRMHMVGPAPRIGGPFLGRIDHDRAEFFADICAGKIARGLGGVYDRGADGEQVLQPLASAIELRFDRLALGNV